MEQAKAGLSRLFDKSLTDLVRGIRSHKKQEAHYISQCIQEIKEELKSREMEKKTIAIQKLTYLQMLGYDMSWAAFNVIEVMSQPKFTGKRIGYLAASQSFHEGTEVVMLATNLIKKDCQSANLYDAGIAINCLANVCTPDLARDLASDIVALMGSSKPYVRKKAVLVMYKVFLKFPDSLRPSFPKLKEKLEDPDQAVISSAVNVICELARKNPKNYLSLAPTLFKLLTSNYNNWMLIKIIKLFGALTPLEPRLSKKLVDPLSNLINNTPATSLLYECIQTCTIGMAEHLPLIKLCISKLRTFVEDPDQNLKYLGLLALNNIMKIHPKAVAEHRDLVLNCLDDEDVTIRMRALDLLTGMVGKRNLPDIVAKLLEHLEKAEGQYRDELVEKTITLCSQSTYAHITDFEWYLTVLVKLTRVQGTSHGALIASQILDVLIRVDVVRSFGVKQMVTLLRDSNLYSNPGAGGVCEVLYAAAWTVGEFARNLGPISPLDVLGALLQPQAASLPAHIQGVFVQNALKVFAFVVAAAHGVLPAVEGEEEPEDEEEDPHEHITEQTVEDSSTFLNQALQPFIRSVHIDVQERACFALELLRLFNQLRANAQSAEVAAELASLFDGALNPVAKGAQRKVPVPDDLDLDTPINAPEPEDDNPFEEEDEPPKSVKTESDEEEKEASIGYEDSEEGFLPRRPKDDTAESARRREQKRQRDAANPYMLGSGRSSRRPPLSPTGGDDQGGPVVPLNPGDFGSLVVGSPSGAPVSSRGGDAKSKNKPRKVYTVKRDEEAPEGADSDDDKKKRKGSAAAFVPDDGSDPLSSINLDEPLRDNEVLPVARHRTDIEREKKAAEAAKAAKEKARAGGRSERPDKPGRPERPDKKERGGGEKGERRRPKEGGERKHRPKQTEGTLVDLDISGPATPAVAGDEDYAAVASPPTVPLTPEDADKRKREHRSGGEKRERRDSRGEGRERKERRERPDGEKREHRHREHREGGERERKERGERGERGERRKSEAKEPVAEGSSRRPKYVKLLENSTDLQVSYDIVATTERGKLQLLFLLENTADSDIADVSVTFTDSLSVRVSKSQQTPGVNVFAERVAPGQKVRAETGITASQISAQKLKGSVSYNYLGEARKLDVVLALQVSSFVAAVTLAKEQFAEILTGEAAASLSLNSTRINTTGDFKATVNTLTSSLHLEPVQVGAENASAYGRSVLGHHIALRLKASGNEATVDIKASDASVGSALIREVTALFR